MIHYQPEQRQFIYSRPNAETATWLEKLRWTQFDDVWVTGNPRMVSPFWSHIADPNAQQIVGPYAWNYQSSWATGPLPGTGVDQIYFPQSMTPYPFQIAGVQLATRRPFTLIADEMGLGKSAQALGVANIVKPRSLLIACPAFLVPNWADECAKWITYAAPITCLTNAKKQIPRYGITILPYSRAHAFWRRVLEAGRWDMVIADEVHYIKGEEAARVRPFFGWSGMPGIFHYSNKTICLSGTPTPNNPAEIYNLLTAGAAEIMTGTTREIFKREFCEVDTYKGKDKVTGGKSEECLNVELRASGFMVRRQKSTVLTQLPPKIMQLVHMSPTKEIADLAAQEVDLYDLLQAKVFPAGGMMVLAATIAELRKKIGVLKAPMLAEYIAHIFRQGETHVVAFMWHSLAIDTLAEAFDRIMPGVDIDILDGRGTMKRRHSAVKRFQSSNHPSLIIGQIVAAGVGVTLTRASHVVLGEISWNPADVNQAIDRVHRISQTRQVTAHIPTYPNAVEARVLNRMAQKQLTSDRILDQNIDQLVNCLLTLEGLGDKVSA